MFDKKGQGLSIETIVMVSIAVLVLVLVILIFSGQSGELFSTVGDFISGIFVPEIDPSGVIR
jgi:hypothetical protein